MPVTLRNTDILFNDGSTQSTAAGAVTTTAVLNATAGASAGAVGSYALMRSTNYVSYTAQNTTRAGSGLYFTSASGLTNTVVLGSGTWRLMGAIENVNGLSDDITSVWLRIS